MDTQREIVWAKNDSPPKKGTVIENFYGERFKVVSVVKGSPDYIITLENE